eukprot:1660446-Amphidinium_carterae.1
MSAPLLARLDAFRVKAVRDAVATLLQHGFTTVGDLARLQQDCEQQLQRKSAAADIKKVLRLQDVTDEMKQRQRCDPTKWALTYP